MPFTPLHMGPGLAIKAVAGERFSLLAFGLAQVAMDIEPLIGLMRGAEVLHGPTHTYLAAACIALAVAAVAPPLCRPILRRWNRELSASGLAWLAAPGAWSATAVVAGALTGTLSHVALDSFMHADIAPLMPWSRANGLLGEVSIAALHTFCVGAGAFGIAAWFARRWRERRGAHAAQAADGGRVR